MAGRVKIKAYKLRDLAADPSPLDGLSDPHGHISCYGADGLKLLTENPFATCDDLALVLAIHRGQVVGRLGFLSGTAMYDGDTCPVYWLSGYSVDENYRSSGAGAMLLLQGLATRRALLASGGSSRQAEEVYKRTGFRALGPLRRYVYFYTSRVLVEKYVRNRWLAPILSAVSQPLLNLYNLVMARRPLDILSVEPAAAFGPEIEAVFEGDRRNYFPRTAPQLNWVMRHRKIEAFKLLSGGRLAGYALLRVVQAPAGGPHNLPAMKCGTILDYYLPEGCAGMKADLLHFCICYFRRAGAEIMECQALDPPMEQECARLGMVQISGFRVFFRPQPAKTLDPSAVWFLPMGTSDVIIG
jgi:GNAT superfamily N-acetyltransferase